MAFRPPIPARPRIRRNLMARASTRHPMMRNLRRPTARRRRPTPARAPSSDAGRIPALGHPAMRRVLSGCGRVAPGHVTIPPLLSACERLQPGHPTTRRVHGQVHLAEDSPHRWVAGCGARAERGAWPRAHSGARNLGKSPVTTRPIAMWPETRAVRKQGRVGAEGGIRTRTTLRSAVFETAASAIPPLRHGSPS